MMPNLRLVPTEIIEVVKPIKEFTKAGFHQAHEVYTKYPGCSVLLLVDNDADVANVMDYAILRNLKMFHALSPELSEVTESLLLFQRSPIILVAARYAARGLDFKRKQHKAHVVTAFEIYNISEYYQARDRCARDLKGGSLCYMLTPEEFLEEALKQE